MATTIPVTCRLQQFRSQGNQLLAAATHDPKRPVQGNSELLRAGRQQSGE